MDYDRRMLWQQGRQVGGLRISRLLGRPILRALHKEKLRKDKEAETEETEKYNEWMKQNTNSTATPLQRDEAHARFIAAKCEGRPSSIGHLTRSQLGRWADSSLLAAPWPLLCILRGEARPGGKPEA
jgi:hypothetical protein